MQVWEKVHALLLDVYRITKRFPVDERYRLTDQICRAAVSVPTNIAEADGRYHKREQIQFLFMARGSLQETRYLIRVAMDLGYIAAEEHDSLRERYDEASKMLNGLIKAKRAGISGKIAFLLACCLPIPAVCSSLAIASVV